jgi:hypothetical protein
VADKLKYVTYDTGRLGGGAWTVDRSFSLYQRAGGRAPLRSVCLAGPGTNVKKQNTSLPVRSNRWGSDSLRVGRTRSII